MQKTSTIWNMRLRPGDPELFAAIDAWRNGQIDDRKRSMSQAEAVRRLLRQALKAEQGFYHKQGN